MPRWRACADRAARRSSSPWCAPGSALPLEFTVERAQVDVHSVAMVRLEGGFIYARITTFSDTTALDFAAGIARLRRDLGAKPRGVVLDLRNNPGGVLESAVEVADQLLEDGVDRHRRRPHARGALQHGGHAGRSAAGRAGGGAGEWRHRVGGGNPRRRAAGSPSRHAAGPAHLRQGIGADRDAAVRRTRHQAHHLALLHAVGPLHPGQRHRAGPSTSKPSTRSRWISRTRARARRWRRATPACAPALDVLRGTQAATPRRGTDREHRDRAPELTARMELICMVRRFHPASRRAPGRAAA